ncbi:MAG: hypothetical protein PHF50_01605 [Patescibacteria group bacterium]|nr:hypothetical protein [Patescibacteria group bacterium]
MIRSHKYVFVPFCLLAQGVRASGIVKHYASVVTPVVELLIEHKVNIIQMRCPELVFDFFNRRPCGKPKYDTEENHRICRKVAMESIWFMEMLLKNGKSIEVIIGVDFSPSCAVKRLTGNRPGSYQGGQGIFIEELKELMRQKGFHIPFVGIQIYHIDETIKELRLLLEGGSYGKSGLGAHKKTDG